MPWAASAMRAPTGRAYSHHPTILIISLLLLFCHAVAGSSMSHSKASYRNGHSQLSQLVFDREASIAPVQKRQSGSSITAFDTGHGVGNMTAACDSFFNKFLKDPQMISCQPISMLLMTSSGFFQASKAASSLQSVVSTSCQASESTCGSLMDSYATQLKTNANCAQDYAAQNPYVLQAYDGFVAYRAMYNATCQQAHAGGYCFVNALTTSTSPDDSYVYYLPLGVSLPASARPDCSPCLQTTLDDWAPLASNGSTPLSSAFNPAVTQVDANCGSTFAKQAAAPSKNAAPALAFVPAWAWMLLVLITVILS